MKAEREHDLKGLLSHFDQAELIEIAKDLIRIKSPTEDEREVVAFVAALFERNGINFEIQTVSEGRPQVIGRLRGSGGGRSLMLNGHLDNDAITVDWKGDPYEPRIEGNRLWGAGIHNMKSGVAALLEAGLTIKRSGVSLRGDLVMACVVGELQGGKGTLHMLQSGIRTDLAVVPEPYSTNIIITKCVGVHKCAITIIGRSVHTSRSETGLDAIAMMWLFIERLKLLRLGCDDPDYPALPKINVASIIGGRGRDWDLRGPSNLADCCTIIVDVRYSGSISPAEIDAEFVALLDGFVTEHAGLQYEYDHPPPPVFRVGGADMPPTNVSAETEIAELVATQHEMITGRKIAERGVVLPYSYCGNDTAHLDRAGIPCCLYGPRGYPDDVEKHVRLDEMIECSKVLTAVAASVCA